MEQVVITGLSPLPTPQQAGEMFNSWLYLNYPIGNGDMLIQLWENPSVLEAFLEDMDLPADLEVEY